MKKKQKDEEKILRGDRSTKTNYYHLIKEKAGGRGINIKKRQKQKTRYCYFVKEKAEGRGKMFKGDRNKEHLKEKRNSCEENRICKLMRIYIRENLIEGDNRGRGEHEVKEGRQTTPHSTDTKQGQ